MTTDLKRNTIKAVIWNSSQRYGTLLMTFVTNIFLARVLTPEDFGLIGLLTVFVAIASSLVDTGFSASIIQDQNSTDSDYNTVFVWNILLSVVLCCIMAIVAPSIASYFNNEELIVILRVVSGILIINALSTVQIAILTKRLQFKILAIRTLCASFLSCTCSVILAMKGVGIWALVIQIIVHAVVSTSLIWIISSWKPKLQFSWVDFRKMFKFGSMIFVSGICDTLYMNIQSFIIGKSFSIKDLGYYTQASKLESVPVQGTSSILSQVLFPVYASIAADRTRHIAMVRKNVRLITFITFPLMLILILVAKPLIELLFTEKWLPSVPLFQILCVFGFFQPLNQTNTEIFKGIGRSDIYLILQTIKRIVNIGIILFSIKFGIMAMMWAIALTGFISYGLNIFFTHRVFSYSYSSQFKDIFPAFFSSLLAMVLTGSVVVLLKSLKFPQYIEIMGLSLLYFLLYIVISIYIQKSTIILLKNIIKR